eukprot:715119-Alexandrium_andersonii.AAC.1
MAPAPSKMPRIQPYWPRPGEGKAVAKGKGREGASRGTVFRPEAGDAWKCPRGRSLEMAPRMPTFCQRPFCLRYASAPPALF